MTQEPGDAAKIAEEYGKDVELFVCSGGDGTLNSVISGIMRLEKRPEIGYLPAGSTNDFARSLKIPANLTKAAQDVVSGKSYGVDIGKFGDERYFVYIAAFGAFKMCIRDRFKRSCLPDGPKVGSVAVSPRGDLRMPSDAARRIWMDEVEKLDPEGGR